MIKLVAALTALLILSGCSYLPSKEDLLPTASSTTAHESAIKAITTWKADGKLGVRTKDDSSSVLFSWNQKEQAFRIELKGPLGQTGGIVSGDQHFATLEIPGEQAIAAASPEELLALRFEWELPVRNAQYWVKGIPAPDSPFDATYADNRLATLTQDGWIITYHRYLDAADVVLPEKLTLAREDLKLTIIFSDWYLID